MVMGSCTDVLDYDPIDKISDADVWEQEDLMEAYITRMYDSFPFIDYGWPSRHAIFRADIATTNTGASNTNASTTGGMTHANDHWGYWNYSYIRELNVFLENLPDSPIDEAVKRRMEGEIRTMRAAVYLRKQKLYGGVPLVDIVLDPFEDIDEQYLVRSTEEQIADFIDSELATAIELMNWDQNQSATGAFNKAVAYAYKARANLWAASIANYGSVQADGLVGIPANRADEFYQKAADAANAIIDSGIYALYDESADKVENFQNVFLEDGHSEVILEVIKDGLNKTNRQNYENVPPRASAGGGGYGGPLLEYLLRFENVDGTDGDPEFGPDHLYDSAVEPWLNKDPRLHATVLFNGQERWGLTIESWDGTDSGLVPDPNNIVDDPAVEFDGIPALGLDARRHGWETNGRTGMYPLKYIHETPLEQAGRGDINWKEIRLAEMYLIVAEAEYELGNPGPAADALNATRVRAGISLVDADSITLETIRNERTNELAYEGFRWWDLRRWRTAQDVLHNTEVRGLRPIRHHASGRYYFLPEPAEEFTRSFSAEHYYNPITDNRRENQPQLVENPGY